MEEKTHWKKLVNPDYLGSYSFQPGQEMILTIKQVKREKVKGQKGKEQECSVIHFEEKIKPMIVNRLNSKTISKIYQTPYIEDWVGKKIQLFVDIVEAFGEFVDAIRVRPFVPGAALPLLNDSGKHYDNCVKGLKEGSTIDQMRKYYTITDEIENKLKKDANIK